MLKSSVQCSVIVFFLAHLVVSGLPNEDVGQKPKVVTVVEAVADKTIAQETGLNTPLSANNTRVSNDPESSKIPTDKNVTVSTKVNNQMAIEPPVKPNTSPQVNTDTNNGGNGGDKDETANQDPNNDNAPTTTTTQKSTDTSTNEKKESTAEEETKTPTDIAVPDIQPSLSEKPPTTDTTEPPETESNTPTTTTSSTSEIPTTTLPSAEKNEPIGEPQQSEVSIDKAKDEGMSSGIIALVMAIVFAVVVIIVYVGLLLWRRYLEYRYGNRELLVNDLEFDTNDLRHFEL